MSFLHPKQAQAYNYQPSDETNPPPPYSSISSVPQGSPPQQQPQRSTSPSVPYGYPPQQQRYPPQQQPYPPQQPQYPPQQQPYPPQQPPPQRAPSPSFPYGANPSIPQPPTTSAPIPRTLHIYREGLTQKRGTVYDSDKTTPLYLIRNSWAAGWSGKPNVEITSPGTGQVIATVTFHAWSRTVDFMLHGQALPMDPAGWFTRSYTFQSPIGTLKWQKTGIWGYSLQCVTERGEWLARFDTAYFSMRKEGRLEIVSRELPQMLVDQLVVTGIAMVEIEKRAHASAGASGGGGGA